MCILVNKPLRVLQVIHGMDQGGIENFLMNVYRKIDRTTIQFDFIAHTHKKCFFDDEIKDLGGEIFHSPDYRVINHFEYITWWNEFFKAHPEYMVIHSHLDSSANIHLRIAKKFNLVTISHAHSTSEGFGAKALIKKILKIGFSNCCDYKFGCSKDANIWLYGEKTVLSDECEVIKNGIFTQKYIFNSEKRTKIRNQLEIEENTIVLGHVGRICKNKNQAFLVDVVSCMKRKGYNVKLFLVGLDNKKDLVAERAKQLNVLDDIVFLGVRSDINILMQAMDVFVFPSIYEGLPVALIEAQSAGLYCVASDTITKDVAVTDLVSFISLERSADYWAQSILEKINEPRRDMSNEIISSGYDIKTTVNRLTEFYNEVAFGD